MARETRLRQSGGRLATDMFPRIGPQQRLALGAFIKELAGILRLGFRLVAVPQCGQVSTDSRTGLFAGFIGALDLTVHQALQMR
jgi:hypothetical protein